MASLSLLTTPSLVQSLREKQVTPSTAAKIWAYVYNTGKTQNPPLAAITSAVFFYLAWSVREGTALSLLAPRNSSLLYSAAGLLTGGIVPFTLACMMATNRALEASEGAKDEVEATRAEVETLLERWGVLNAVRAGLPLVGSIVGVMAVIP
jgi:membrane protein YqaA with SNARE-associated domain